MTRLTQTTIRLKTNKHVRNMKQTWKTFDKSTWPQHSPAWREEQQVGGKAVVSSNAWDHIQFMEALHACISDRDRGYEATYSLCLFSPRMAGYWHCCWCWWRGGGGGGGLWCAVWHVVWCRVQCGVVCGVRWFGVVWCGMVLYGEWGVEVMGDGDCDHHGINDINHN